MIRIYVNVWIGPFSCVNFSSVLILPCWVRPAVYTPELMVWSCLGRNRDWRIDPPSSPLPARGDLCQTLTTMQPASVWPYTLLDLKERFYCERRVYSPARRFSGSWSIDVKCVRCLVHCFVASVPQCTDLPQYAAGMTWTFVFICQLCVSFLF